MIRIKFVLFIVYALCLFACNRSIHINEHNIGKAEHSILVLPREDDFRGLDLSSYLDSVKFVKLELTDESIIGEISKVIVYEECIYILDNQTSSLFIFDMEGRYLHKIAKIGQGPGEYTQLDFFDIDKENKQIVLTDLMAYWIMRYDLNGNFLSRQKIPVWCEGVSLLPNKGIVLYVNFRNNSQKLEQEYNLIYLDSVMNFKQAYFPYYSKDFDQNKRPATSMSGQFYTFKDNTYFSFPGGSIVYQVTNDSLINKYQFVFEKETLSIDIGNPINSTHSLDRLTEGKYYGLIKPVMENDQLLFFSMHTNMILPYNVYYSKKSGNTLSSYFFYLGSLTSIFQTSYNSWIVSEIQSHELIATKNRYLDYVKNHKKTPIDQYTKELLSFAEKLTEDDNPVLMFYKLKPF